MNDINSDISVAVLVPCYNEGSTIARVVADFKTALPHATLYVYDNNSTDQTYSIASEAGAVVRTERLQGKGNVVRRMFADIDADVYLMVDGDATYDAQAASKVVDLIVNGNDFVNVARVHTEKEAYRMGHQLGNSMLTGLVGLFFGNQTQDMLSGYKGFSRRFVKSFPAMSTGFEIETELMIHALELRVSLSEIEAPYFSRPEGSTSKLSTFKDGWKILRTIGWFIKNEKPIPFFSSLAIILTAVSALITLPLFIEYLNTGLLPRFPTAIASAFILLTAILSFFVGLILDVVTLSRREAKRLRYLEIDTLEMRNR